MRGATLYPLNVLRTAHPDLYEQERAKYAGRETLLDVRIPLVGVRWSDALHLSPIHPYRLAEAWRAAGFSWPDGKAEFLRIPIERLGPAPAVWFGSGALSEAGSLPGADVALFDEGRYAELVELPPAHCAYLRGLPDDAVPRPFAYVPHVLVAGPVDVEGVAVVRADVEPG
jgi:hypothetical protein